MKKLLLVLLATATALAIVPKASADPLITGNIDFYGNDSFTATSITVDPDASIGNGNLGTIAPTGDFAELAGDNVTISSFTGTLPELMLTGPDGLTFTLTSDDIVNQSSTFWNIVGVGDFTLNGFASTPYDFSFTTTNVGGQQTVSFTATVIPTPEPSSLLLLGSGLFGLAILVFYRKAKQAPGLMLNM